MKNYTSELATIYALCDPDTQEIRYVGMSSMPQTRYTHHKRNKISPHRPMYKWIEKLRKKGKVPEFKVLEEVPSPVAREAEIRWIQQLSQNGTSLLNHNTNPSIEKVSVIGGTVPYSYSVWLHKQKEGVSATLRKLIAEAIEKELREK